LQKEPTERQRFLEQACGDYDVHPLTGEFVILVPATPQTSPTLPPPQTIRTVLNWFDDVREAQ
jgi:hypothetical protein